MPESQRLPYVEIDRSLGAASALPYAPLTLVLGKNTTSVSGLMDSGAALRVLPFDVGVRLGAIWEQQTIPVQLAGNLADSVARAIVVTAVIAQFAPVRLAFAWTRNNQVPVILGQVDFFMEFDVCFFRSQPAIEITPRNSTGN